jgi:UDP-N-acetylmuramate--alanine ligase
MAEYRNIYFIGIGGIGMSAIARYYNARGFKVSGYDKTPSPLTHALEQEGIEVHYEDNISFIPKDTESTLVVYTPAIPKDMGELVYVQEKGYRVIKRSRMLGEITDGQRCMAVAGTHGKTTTSTFLSHIFTDTGEGCSAFLGGISKNYGSNLLIHGNDVVVVEADEFDRSFLQLYPEIAVITSMDADHLDIYGDEAHIHEAFKAFASQVKGTVIAKHGLDISEADTKAKIMTYSYDDPAAEFYAELTEGDGNGRSRFNLHWPGGVISDCIVGIPGWVNIENAVAASAIALTYGLDPEKIRKALATFAGVKRRFDIQLETEKCVYIDDYAHHPREITASLTSIKGNFPGYRLTAIFQPHLYTRTRDFADGFAEALSNADRLILLDIYPAREEPIPGVTSEIIFRNITTEDKVLLKKAELMEHLKGMELSDKEVFVTVGAGDIDRFIGPITELLKKHID